MARASDLFHEFKNSGMDEDDAWDEIQEVVDVLNDEVIWDFHNMADNIGPEVCECPECN